MIMVTCEQLWQCYCTDYFSPAYRAPSKIGDIYFRGVLLGHPIYIWSWDQWREASFMQTKGQEAMNRVEEFCSK